MLELYATIYRESYITVCLYIEYRACKSYEKRGRINRMDNIQQLTYNHSNFERKKKTIMICDDERDVLEFFGLVFESRYDVMMVDSGKDCIEKYIKEKNMGNKIDLILLDYRLGDMLGDSVARKIREHNGTKIILISAYELDADLIKELENSNYIRKYVKKPVHMDRLIELVDEMVC
jgi:CheY-like chemotaxis protein